MMFTISTENRADETGKIYAYSIRTIGMNLIPVCPSTDKLVHEGKLNPI